MAPPVGRSAIWRLHLLSEVYFLWEKEMRDPQISWNNDLLSSSSSLVLMGFFKTMFCDKLLACSVVWVQLRYSWRSCECGCDFNKEPLLWISLNKEKFSIVADFALSFDFWSGFRISGGRRTTGRASATATGHMIIVTWVLKWLNIPWEKNECTF